MNKIRNWSPMIDVFKTVYKNWNKISLCKAARHCDYLKNYTTLFIVSGLIEKTKCIAKDVYEYRFSEYFINTPTDKLALILEQAYQDYYLKNKIRINAISDNPKPEAPIEIPKVENPIKSIEPSNQLVITDAEKVFMLRTLVEKQATDQLILKVSKL